LLLVTGKDYLGQIFLKASSGISKNFSQPKIRFRTWGKSLQSSRSQKLTFLRSNGHSFYNTHLCIKNHLEFPVLLFILFMMVYLYHENESEQTSTRAASFGGQAGNL